MKLGITRITRNAARMKAIRPCLFIMAMLLVFMQFPISAFALEEAEQGHNHTQGYCYVCKEGDPSWQQFSYNYPEYLESETPAVVIGDVPYWSFAEAVQAAAPGDTLHVQSSMVLSYPVMINKDLTLVGDSSDITITRGFSGEALFTVCGGATLQVGYLTMDGGLREGYYGHSIFQVLEGSFLVLSNGTTLQYGDAAYGGGVYVDAQSTLQMNGETDAAQITACSADYSGGGIYSEGSVQILPGAYVTGNTAEYGGGIWTANGYMNQVDPGVVYGNTDHYGAESDIRDASAQGALSENEINGEGFEEGFNEGLDEGFEEGFDENIEEGYAGNEGEVPEVCTVYFNLGDGSDLIPVQVPYGDVVAAPQDIAWEGHTFTGWAYTPMEDGVFYSYDFSQPVYQDFTVYALWEQSPEQSLEQVPEQIPEQVPEQISDAQLQMQQEEFDEAWDPQDDQQLYMQAAPQQLGAQQVVIPPVDAQQVNAQLAAEPPADAQPVYYQVDFEYNVPDWVGETQTVEAGGYAEDPYDPSTMPRDQYNFVGWYYYTDEGEFPFQFDQPVNQDYYLTAKWEEVQPVYVTVTYDPNDGVSAASTSQIEAGSLAAEATATREGYTFNGWYYYDEFGAYVPYDFSQAVYSDLTLYAEWTKVPEYTVNFNFNADGEIPAQTQTIQSGQTARDPYDPATMSRSGRSFLGWFYTDEYGTEYPFSFDTPITADWSLYAKWQSQTFAVTFDPCNGSNSILQTVQYGQVAVQPEVQAPNGYRLEGWYQDAGYVSRFDLANTPITGNLTLYAKWELIPVEYYTVTFHANGHGTAPDPQTVKGGEAAQKPATPKTIGYTFTGWFTDAQCTQAYNFQEPSNYDITLYAGWTVNRYTVRFDANSGTGVMASIDLSYDQRMNLPANSFTKSGYYFLGWNTLADGTGVSYADRGEIVNLTDVNGGTVDLFAQWKNIYNVIEGANSKVMKGSGRGLTFRCDGDYSKFTGIRIDGQIVPSTQYTAASGSTVVTLHANYVDQLTVGVHSLRFEYTDGGVETSFEILSRTPTTGDTNNTLIWIIVAIAAIVIIGVVITILVIRRNRRDDDDPYFDDFEPGGQDFTRDAGDSYNDNYNDNYNDSDDDSFDGGDNYDDNYDDGYDDSYDDDTYEQYVDDQLKRHRKRK